MLSATVIATTHNKNDAIISDHHIRRQMESTPTLVGIEPYGVSVFDL